MAYLVSKKGKRLPWKQSKGKSDRPSRTKAVRLMGKDYAALVKSAEEKSVSGGWFKFEVPGDVLAGKVLSIKEEDGKFGPQTVLALETPDGPRSVRCNESLKRGLEEGNAKRGSKVAIVYRENVSTGRGRPFKVFAVTVK